MDMSFLPIVLNVIVLLSLVIPIVRGYMNGFVKTVLHLLRFVIAAVVSFIFVKPLGILIKEKWLGGKFYDVVHGAISNSFDGSADGMADAVPGVAVAKASEQWGNCWNSFRKRFVLPLPQNAVCKLWAER